jgi:hypothetical protein
VAASTAGVYGNSAFCAGDVLQHLHTAGIDAKPRSNPGRPGGKFTKDQFDIDLDTVTVNCPNQVSLLIRPVREHPRHRRPSRLRRRLHHLPAAPAVHRLETGRHITISRWETHLATARARRQDPA